MENDETMNGMRRWVLWGGLAMMLSLTACGGATPPSDDGSSSDAAAGVVHPETWPKMSSPLEEDAELETAVDELFGKLTLEEKVGQVIQAEIQHVTPEDVKTYHLGSVLNGGGSYPGANKHSTPEDWLALADAFWHASMDTSDGGTAVPLIWGSDAVHGHNNVIGATLFPHNIGLGAANNPDLLYRIGEVTAREMAVTGLDWNFGPTVATPRDDRWGRSYEGYSEDPEIVRDYAGQMVLGLQGQPNSEEFLGEGHIVSTAKHFLGDGGTIGGKDQGDNQASETELRDIHAQGYVTALDAGVQVVMASFNSWHGKKLHGHKDLLNDVLKDQMGFAGFVVGDWNGHGQVQGCSNSDCPQSFNAGVDMFMVPEDWKALYKNTLQQVKDGIISEERLEDAVKRILRVKIRAGIADGPPSSRPLAGKTEIMGAQEHRDVARQAVRESLVLLKNNGQILPLAPQQKVLVAGDGADDIGKQSGGWTITWQGTGNTNAEFPGATSIWGGIDTAVQAVGGQAVLSEDGDWQGAFGGAKPDVAIVVFGEDPYAEFQGDRDTLDYENSSSDGLAILKPLQEAGIPTVSVFISGRPMWVHPEINASDAFVAAWLPGSEGGGVAEVLFQKPDGSVNHDFKGRLSFSWPDQANQFLLNRGAYDSRPLFEYGYGLAYGDTTEVGPLSEDPGVATVDNRTSYFNGGALAPWKLYLADTSGQRVVVSSGHAATSDGVSLTSSAVDHEVQEDARQLVWSGEGPADAIIHQDQAIDLSRESNGDLVLSMMVRVDEAPSSTVILSMGCESEECHGGVDMTSTLRDMPAGTWQPLRLRLKCFEAAGADMSRVHVPYRWSTDGSLSLAFAKVKLGSLADGEVICPGGE